MLLEAGELRVGVLSLQGDFAEHTSLLSSLGVDTCQVRSKQDLEGADALVIPGGESTTILKLLDLYDLRDMLVKRVEAGMAVFGTCAGAIVLADRVSDGERPLGLLQIGVIRNAYGRQIESFETSINVEGLDEPVRGVFIRAPLIEETGDEIEVLATYEDHPVLVRQGRLLACTFHPELAGETRIHSMFLEMAESH